MREVYIVGVGMTKFGKFLERSVDDLGSEAVLKAIKDAGTITQRDIQTAYVGEMATGVISGQPTVVGQTVLAQAGITSIPIVNVEDACATSSAAFREAWITVGAGLYDVALALGVEKLYTTDQGISTEALSGGKLEGRHGQIPAAHWAMIAKLYMEKYGVSKETIAQVSVKNRHNAHYNPLSQYRDLITLEQVLSSRMVADPLTLFQCCPIGDGAAAAILCSKDGLKKLGFSKAPITVAWCALASGTYEPLRDLLINGEIVRSSREAYKATGLEPKDIDIAEVHDCFSIAEYLRCESLGLCGRGEYGRLLKEGKWNIGGELPVNPSGGLLSKGHPTGATGVAQVVEVVRQMRGEAEPERQLKDVMVGLTHCSGGLASRDTAAGSVIILKNDGGPR